MSAPQPVRERWFAVLPGRARDAANAANAEAARVRLYCLPYAGAGHTAYHGWRDALPAQVALAPVCLPGRGMRTAEAHAASIEELATALAAAIARAARTEAPRFALFGHSMGALLGFETARVLETVHGLSPTALVMSGRGAPALPSARPPFSTLPDGAFADAIAAMGGMPAEIRETPEALAFFLPVLRADIALCERWRYRPGPRLGCPITVLGGQDDIHAPPAMLAAWRDETLHDCRQQVFAGGHFFLHDAAPAVVDAIAEAVLGAAALNGEAGHALA